MNSNTKMKELLKINNYTIYKSGNEIALHSTYGRTHYGTIHDGKVSYDYPEMIPLKVQQGINWLINKCLFANLSLEEIDEYFHDRITDNICDRRKTFWLKESDWVITNWKGEKIKGIEIHFIKPLVTSFSIWFTWNNKSYLGRVYKNGLIRYKEIKRKL